MDFELIKALISKHARKLQVVEILGPAPDLVRGIDPGIALAYDGKIVNRHVCCETSANP
jgi:hypothetical protein